MGYVWPLNLRDASGSEWVGVHRPELADLSELFDALLKLPETRELSAEDWRHALPPSVVFLRSLGPSTAQLVLRAGAVTDIVVKALAPQPGTWWRIAGSMRRSRAFRAFQWTHRLRAFGLEAPRPLGYLERARSPSRHRSFHVTQHVEAMSLLALVDERLTPVVEQGPSGLLERRARLFALGRVLADLEDLGLDLAELEAEHLCWDGRGFRPVGLEAPIPRLSSPSSGLSHFLERHAAAIGQSKTDQLRVLSAYMIRSGGSRAERRRLLAGYEPAPSLAAE